MSRQVKEGGRIVKEGVSIRERGALRKIGAISLGCKMKGVRGGTARATGGNGEFQLDRENEIKPQKRGEVTQKKERAPQKNEFG